MIKSKIEINQQIISHKMLFELMKKINSSYEKLENLVYELNNNHENDDLYPVTDGKDWSISRLLGGKTCETTEEFYEDSDDSYRNYVEKTSGMCVHCVKTIFKFIKRESGLCDDCIKKVCVGTSSDEIPNHFLHPDILSCSISENLNKLCSNCRKNNSNVINNFDIQIPKLFD